MDAADPKAILHGYLQTAREALLWKLDGLSEYDARRPMVPTGTNLLGLVKHLAGVEIGYFGDTFGRPYASPPAWMSQYDDDPTVDMWAAAEETRADIVGLYRSACEHADHTINELTLDAQGEVPWWPQERQTVTLHQILVHMIAETHRHAGHADIVRELIDGTVGLRQDNDNMAHDDAAAWEQHRARLEQVARRFADRP